MPSVSVPDPNALSLVEYFQYSNAPLVKEVTYSMIMAGIVVQDLPMITSNQLVFPGSRIIGGLPAAQWKSANSLPTIVKTNTKAFSEQTYQILEGAQSDRIYMKAANTIEPVLDTQVESMNKGIAFDLNDKFINNDHITGDKNCFVGLKYRVSTAGQAEFGNNAECLIDGGGLNLAVGGVSSTNANTLMTLLQRGLNALDDKTGGDTVIYCNEVFMYLLEQAVRYMGPAAGFSQTEDAFDRPVLKYKGAMIRDAGRKAPSADGTQNTYVISNVENANGTDTGNGNYTSIYMVKKGKKSFAMTQFEPLVPIGPERIPGTTIYQVTLQWVLGIWNPDTRAIVRIFGLKTS